MSGSSVKGFRSHVTPVIPHEVVFSRGFGVRGSGWTVKEAEVSWRRFSYASLAWFRFRILRFRMLRFRMLGFREKGVQDLWDLGLKPPEGLGFTGSRAETSRPFPHQKRESARVPRSHLKGR